MMNLSLTKQPYLRLIVVLAMAVIGIVLSVGLFYLTNSLEEKNILSTYERKADERIRSLRNIISDCLQITEVLGAFYDSSEKVERHEFQTFVKPVLQRYVGVKALEWIPRVPHARRSAYEQKARQDGFPDFEFREMNPASRAMERAGTRAEYFPVYFVAPRIGNRPALGFDLASDATRLAALEKARDTGKVTATARISLVQNKKESLGFLLFKPQYDKNLASDTIEARRKHLSGFVLSVFQVGTLFEKALETFEPIGINISIYDQSTIDKRQFLYTHKSRIYSGASATDAENLSIDSSFFISEDIKVADRTWKIICSPTSAFIQGRRTWQPRVILLVGLLFTCGICCFVWLLMKRAATLRQYSEEISKTSHRLSEEINERKRAEETLSEANKIINRSPAVAFLWKNEAGWPVEFVSENVKKLIGYSSAEFVERKISYKELIHSEDLERVAGEIASYSKEKGLLTFAHEPYRLITKSGVIKWVEDKSYIRRDSQGIITHLEGIVYDITEEIKLEEQLRQSQKMEAVGTMAGGIAHDFNNILAIILGNAEMAIDEIPIGNPARHNIDEVLEASNRAKDLVRQILAFSRKEKKELIPIRPHSLIKETLKLLRSTTPTTVSIIQSISNNCGTIKADPTQLHQLMMNLFANAVHAMDEKGEITVDLQEVNLNSEEYTHNGTMSSGHHVMLSVSDTGCGMDKEKIERIFDPFYTTKDVGAGTGMGLSVVHGIVESHGGFITVESDVGKGSTFNIYFPVTEENEALKVETTTPFQTSTEHILLVDDEKSLLDMTKRILENLHYKVTTEISSVKALEIFKSNPDQFDLIITDQSMPNMSGSEFVAEILKVRPDIPIILCSGYSSKVSEENAKDKGISKYLNKPYSRKILSDAIREVLDQNL